MKLGNKELDKSESLDVINELLNSSEYTDKELEAMKNLLKKANENQDFIMKKSK